MFLYSVLEIIWVVKEYPLSNSAKSVQGFKLPKGLENHLQVDILQKVIMVEFVMKMIQFSSINITFFIILNIYKSNVTYLISNI